MKSTRIAITLTHAARQVDARITGKDGRYKDTIGRSTVIERDLGRYYQLMRDARAILRIDSAEVMPVILCAWLKRGELDRYYSGWKALDTVLTGSIKANYDELATRFSPIRVAETYQFIHSLKPLLTMALADALERSDAWVAELGSVDEAIDKRGKTFLFFDEEELTAPPLKRKPKGGFIQIQ